ncbi:MAG: hypothetical protein LBF65_01305 [Holosporales bacterium]|nr:hypothetical protein [Holosporales bacterium]
MKYIYGMVTSIVISLCSYVNAAEDATLSPESQVQGILPTPEEGAWNMSGEQMYQYIAGDLSSQNPSLHNDDTERNILKQELKGKDEIDWGNLPSEVFSPTIDLLGRVVAIRHDPDFWEKHRLRAKYREDPDGPYLAIIAFSNCKCIYNVLELIRTADNVDPMEHPLVFSGVSFAVAYCNRFLDEKFGPIKDADINESSSFGFIMD